MQNYFKNLFEYDNWANHEIIQILMSAKDISEQPIRLMAHILGTEQVWLTRLRTGAADGNLIWPDFDITACRAKLRELREAWAAFMAEIAGDLSQRVRYRTSKGTQFDNSIEDILTHVINHSSYHRGQISKILRQKGEEPVNTDYITYARSVTQR